MAPILSNNASSTLAAPILAAATTMTIIAGDALLFPAPGAGQWFPLTIVDPSDNMEIVYCTSRAGAVLTVARAQEGTTAKAFAAGTRVDCRLTAGVIQAKLDAEGYTAADVLAKLLTVDADNSGLNATTLQGFAPPAFFDAVAAATRGNRLRNPAMAVSRERGGASVDMTTGATYVIDQWRGNMSSPAPGGTLRGQRIELATPGGASHRLRFSVLATDTSLAAGDRYYIDHPIEGISVADARFGTGAARQVVLRLGVNSSAPGTFGVSLSNSGGTRSWVGSITISSGEVNTDVVREILVPGDVTGSWSVDNGLGINVRLALAAGTTFIGAPGWSGNNILAPAGQVNFMATLGATFELFDAGFYVGSAAPEWRPPDQSEEEMRCARYWREIVVNHRFDASSAGHALGISYPISPRMRATPAGGYTASTAINVATASIDAQTPETIRFTNSASAAGAVHSIGTIACNARM